MDFLLSGRFWLVLSGISLVVWCIFGVSLLAHRRKHRDEVAASKYRSPKLLRRLAIITFIAAVAALAIGLVVAIVMYGKKPVTKSTRVESPPTIAEDGTRYVELTYPFGTWICQESDQCTGLQVGQPVQFTGQLDSEGNWRYWGLHPAS